MYTIQGLRAFVAVCQQGTVTAAAEAIHRTQPQVSRLISELEADLGFALFVREGRRLTPTIRGVCFFDEARRTLASFDDIERVVSELHVEKDAPVRILAPPHAVHTVNPRNSPRAKKLSQVPRANRDPDAKQHRHLECLSTLRYRNRSTSIRFALDPQGAVCANQNAFARSGETRSR